MASARTTIHSSASARAEPVDIPGGAVSSVKFRGQAIVDAALTALLVEFSMAEANELVLTGSSTGGLATYLHAISSARGQPTSSSASARTSPCP